jgi:hypothetical protein
MPTIKKKNGRKTLKKLRKNTVIVIAKEINEQDTLFPEKVAHAKEILSKAKFLDPRFGGRRKA